MSYTNKLIKQLKPSATLAIKAKSLELKAQGKDIVSLSAGEPDFDTPDHIKAGAIKAMEAGKTKYTAVPGIPELRSAIAKKISKENSIPCEANNVIVSNGGKQAIYEALQVCLEPGDEVLVVSPYWVSYPDMVTLVGATPKVINTTADNSYKLQAEDLKNAISDKTKMLILNSPSNPTGAAYSKEELQALGAVIKDSNILVISDEVYEKITYGNFKFHSLAAAVPEIAENVITINAFSKAYSMTGWRVGYAIANTEIISAMSKLQSQTTSNVNTIAQYAALSALEGPQDFFKDMNKKFWDRMQKAIEMIEAIPGLSIASVPEGAFYLFIRIDELIENDARFSGSEDFCAFLLETVGVAVVPGIAFGDDKAFRISVSLDDETIVSGLSRIASALG